MRILIFTQYFWPESFPVITGLARTLRDQGHYVVVATGKPNYPEGRIFDGYRASGTQKEMFAGDIEVIRIPLRPRHESGALDLLRNYLSFVWSGLRWFPSLLAGYRFDAIVVYAPSPIIAAIAAVPLKWITKASLTVWIQDLWPESLAATGFIRNRVLLGLVGLTVRAIYACANTLLVQSQAFIAPVSRYAARDKIVYYPNSLEVTDECNDGHGPPVPAELCNVLAAHFCAVFAGNIGTAQAVDTLVDVAGRLRDVADVRIVLVGSGSRLGWVKQKKAELGLDNLLLPGRFPAGSMPEIYRHASCLLMTLKDEDIFAYTIPTKLQAYLAAGKPIVAALNGEGARVVTEAGAGLTCAAEDAMALADCVRAIFRMPEVERRRMGDAGRRYFMEHFEMQRQAVRLVSILEQRAVGNDA